MKRKLTLAQLQQRIKDLPEKAAWASSRFLLWKSETSDLSKPEVRRTYTPAKIAEMRQTKLAEAQSDVRKILAEVKAIAAPLLSERFAWQKQALLREARFVKLPKNADMQQQMNCELLEELRALRAENRASRLDDEQLTAELSFAADGDNNAEFNVLLAEAKRRKNAQLALHAESVLQKLQLPEAEEGEKCFVAAERALKELEGLEYALSHAHSQNASGVADFFAWDRKQEAAKNEAEAAKTKTNEAVAVASITF